MHEWQFCVRVIEKKMYYYFYKVGIKGNSDSEKIKLQNKKKQKTD